MRRFPRPGIPTLGVCLGHQSLAQAFGGAVIRHEPVHGKTTEITHDGTGLFEGLDRRWSSGATTRWSSTPARCPTAWR
jgi:anthranilate/para-aminobenzoate synthase component II